MGHNTIAVSFSLLLISWGDKEVVRMNERQM